MVLINNVFPQLILVPMDEIKEFSCEDISDIVTPIDADVLEQLLIDTDFDLDKRSKLIRGFREGFDIGYRGCNFQKNFSDNLPFKVGTPLEMWNKIMSEVELGRYGGPFKLDQIPYEHFIQSPVGLVPKANNKTRLIFHLSFDFDDRHPSINACTPPELCSVKYRDLDHAVTQSVHILESLGYHVVIFYGKTDLVSAFRLLPVRPDQCKWLLLKARHPLTQVWYYFIDKCMPFGSSISCAQFQLFSDALVHILETKLNITVTNYLDDFLFMAPTKEVCNNWMDHFLNICQSIGCPVSEEKTVIATDVITFLGVLLDGQNHVLAIPEEKRIKALDAINKTLRVKKIKIRDVQCLAGLLNFLQRAIIPGWAFTCRMYDKLKLKNKSGCMLKHYHHIKIDSGFKKDCRVWKAFLNAGDNDKLRLCHRFIDINAMQFASTLNFFSDASLNEEFGFGAVFNNSWIYGRWGCPSSVIKHQV